jgi:hypothetical protein
MLGYKQLWRKEGRGIVLWGSDTGTPARAADPTAQEGRRCEVSED